MPFAYAEYFLIIAAGYRLFEKAMAHDDAGVNGPRSLFETILISILLEHEKDLVDLKSKFGVHGGHAEQENMESLQFEFRQTIPETEGRAGEE